MITFNFMIIFLIIFGLSAPSDVISKSKHKTYHMRVTGYHQLKGKTANGGNAIAGKTAAISPRCKHLLGEDVYIEGHGVRHINDLTAKWLDDKYEHCTIDLAVCTKKECKLIGNKRKKVTHLKK